MPSATAAAGDFQTVYQDWRADHNVTNCRYTRAQLVTVRRQAGQAPDIDAYAPGFRDELTREIKRWDNGGCGARARSAIAGLRIKTIKPRGKESVVIKNTGKKTAKLRGATLRDRSGHRIKFPRSTKVKKGRSIRVFTKCRKGVKGHKPIKRGRRIYACRRKPIWNNRGDVVRLVDRHGVLISRRGYGRFKRVKRL